MSPSIPGLLVKLSLDLSFCCYLKVEDRRRGDDSDAEALAYAKHNLSTIPTHHGVMGSAYNAGPGEAERSLAFTGQLPSPTQSSKQVRDSVSKNKVDNN